MNEQDIISMANIQKDWNGYMAYKIKPQFVSPMISESWERSINYGLNPWASPHTIKNIRGSYNCLHLMRENNAKLIDYALPLMKYVCSIIDDIACIIRDNTGFTLYHITSPEALKTYVNSNGLLSDEKYQGTNSSSLALMYQKQVSVCGCENFFMYYHRLSRVASPLFDNNNQIIGVMDLTCNGYHEDFPIFCNVLDIVSRLINLCYIRDNGVESTDLFTDILDSCTDACVCVDYDGTILNCNTSCLQRWSSDTKQSIIGLSILEFLDLQEWTTVSFHPRPIRHLEILDTVNNSNSIITINRIDKPMEKECYLLRFRSEIPYTDNPFALPIAFEETDSVHFLSQNNIIGSSSGISNIRNIIQKISATSVPILIEGSTGVGKELIAQAIHKESEVYGDFVAINCGSIPASLLHSELFGYEEGAFTGARKSGSIGKFASADNGTIFLDEIGEMPLDMQVSLLRFLQDYTVTRIGSNQSRKLSVRIIAATNRNLDKEVQEGRFRQDLFYRLSVVRIKVPDLTERREDILPLAQYFLDKFSMKYHSSLISFDEESKILLQNYSWPGNIRQLQNVLEQLVIFSNNDTLVCKSLLPDFICDYTPSSEESIGKSDDKINSSLHNMETNLVLQTLDKFNGNLTQAAEALGIARTTLYRKLKKLGRI
ncbi:MAG: Propionate catabolism operon regulatory protein [Pelotomaculum sp. PtaB.Bin104]|nr:MAG: Propionate catabolism operon regulatory protein [Pelotomaculum sp. PtaB.Bin104]